MFQAFQQRRWPLLLLWVLIVAAIVAAPSVLPVFRLNLLGRFLSLAIVALGIDLISSINLFVWFWLSELPRGAASGAWVAP